MEGGEGEGADLTTARREHRREEAQAQWEGGEAAQWEWKGGVAAQWAHDPRLSPGERAPNSALRVVETSHLLMRGPFTSSAHEPPVS